ncbi:hypothetical protein BDZ45DRAFT_683860 [Acephala macrosclerotiorum]|nr:hypothetical protein BDZ45DRAFT_683860 [Acephala macrosclerotiorum]
MFEATPANISPRLDDYTSFWRERIVYGHPHERAFNPGTIIFPWTNIHHNEVYNKTITSLEQYKEVLYEWIGKDNKVNDLDKKLPRQQAIDDMIDFLNTSDRFLSQAQIDRITAGAANPSQYLANWKHRVSHNFELKEGMHDGFFHFEKQLYKKWDTKPNTKRQAAKTTRQKLLDSYASEGIYNGIKPSITSLENSYLALVHAHISDKNGKPEHRARDQMYDFIQKGVSDTITKDLCARFIAACPTCCGRWNSDKKRKHEEEEEDTPSPQEKRQRREQRREPRNTRPLEEDFAGLYMQPAPQNVPNMLRPHTNFGQEAPGNDPQLMGLFNENFHQGQMQVLNNSNNNFNFFQGSYHVPLQNVLQQLGQPNGTFDQSQNLFIGNEEPHELSFNHLTPIGQPVESQYSSQPLEENRQIYETSHTAPDIGQQQSNIWFEEGWTPEKEATPQTALQNEPGNYDFNLGPGISVNVPEVPIHPDLLPQYGM